MRKPLPDFELAICRRLRAFREGLLIPRTAMAQRLGISKERLATYEDGRAPLRWEIFVRLAREFRINALWLLYGSGLPIGPVDTEALAEDIDPRALFSSVIGARPVGEVLSVGANAEMSAARSTTWLNVANRIFRQLEHASPEVREALISSGKFVATLNELQDHINRWADTIRQSDPTATRILQAAMQTDEAKREEQATASTTKKDEEEKLRLQKLGYPSIPDDVLSTITDLRSLMQRVQALTTKRGAKRKLAGELEVSTSSVTEWLKGRYEPDGKTTLRLLQWVQEEERKNKTPRQ